MSLKEDEQKTFEEFAAVSTNTVTDIHTALNVWRQKHFLSQHHFDTVRKRVSAYRNKNNIPGHKTKEVWARSELETMQLLVDDNTEAGDVYGVFKKAHPDSRRTEVAVYDRFVRIRRATKKTTKAPSPPTLPKKPVSPPSVTEMLQHAKLVDIATSMRKVFVDGMGAASATDTNYKKVLDLCAYMTGLKR